MCRKVIFADIKADISHKENKMIYIRKNGIFYENDYKPDAKDYIFMKADSIIPHLNEYIHVDDDVTLVDIFLALDSDKELIDIVFGSHMGHNPILPFIDEIKSGCMPESKLDLDYIEVAWVIDQFYYKDFYEKFKDTDDGLFGPIEKPTGDEVNEITVYIDVFGWGKRDEEDAAVEGEKQSSHTSYAIEFTSLYKIKHAPVKLNRQFSIIKTGYASDKSSEVVIDGEREFTVFEFFGAILSEFTFAGSPEERDKQWDKISDFKDQIDERDAEDDEKSEYGEDLLKEIYPEEYDEQEADIEDEDDNEDDNDEYGHRDYK